MWTIYRHTKGLLYIHLGTALHSESCEPMEIYRALYDNDLAQLWVRPKDMFHEEVSPGLKRFTEVGRVRIAAPDEVPPESPKDPLMRSSMSTNSIGASHYLFELPTGEQQAEIRVVRLSRGVVRIEAESKREAKQYSSVLIRAVMEIFKCEDAEMRFVFEGE